MENTQQAEITNTAQENLSIFPEDAQANAQSPATDGNKDQSQQAEPTKEAIAAPTETPKVEGDKPKEGEGAKPAEAKPDGDQKPKEDAPKEIKLELSKDSALTNEELQAVSDYAKEKGLSQEDAQKLLDMREESVQRFREGQTALVEERKTNWLNDLKADKELGGENFATSVSEASRVVKQFFSEEFQKDLENSGLGNYKEFVRGFARIGKLVSDDKMVKGGVRSGGEKSLESYFYDKT